MAAKNLAGQMVGIPYTRAYQQFKSGKLHGFRPNAE